MSGNYQNLYPLPGLKFERTWAPRQAESLDSDGGFVGEVNEAL